MKARCVPILTAVVLLVTAAWLAAQQGQGCYLCWNDGGDWFCANAEDLGHRNCSPSPNGCANWEPLCESGYLQDPWCIWTSNGVTCFL